MPAQDIAHDRDEVAMLVGQASLRGLVPLIGLGALLTAALLYWIVGEPAFAAGFGAALIGAAFLAFYLRKLFPAAPVVHGEMPDWTIARAAADSSNVAIAVTDRAGRLVCASDLFGKWFEGYPTPPSLPLDGNGAEKLATAGRAAWRDGA
ncbi:MAG TPA: hybrid sensor histidine kinase/response regulator, partial [Rhizorhapis sp.]|nr:hybrid sensor histidine kinase/response regulator [Rhizorhapis sp.]